MSVSHPNITFHRRANWWLNAIRPPDTPWLITVALWVVGAVLPMLFIVLRVCDPSGQKIDEPWKSTMEWIHHHRFWLTMLLASSQMVILTSIAIIQWLHPVDFEKTRRVLELSVATHFDSADHTKHTYRATVFKIRGCSWPWGEWVGMVCRSGDTHLSSQTVFYLNRNKPHLSTGITGLSFQAQGATIIKLGLDPSGNKDDYLRECRLAPEEYDGMQVRSCVLFAASIKRKGKPWGFLVLDSTDKSTEPKQSGARSEDTHKTDLGNFAQMIGLLVR